MESIMRYKKTKLFNRGVLAVAVLTTSMSVFAVNQQILCPSVDLIKKSVADLDTISYMGGKYAVWSLNYAFNDANLHWQVMSYASAPDFNAAFGVGQNNVRNVSGQLDKYPTDTKDFYICRYSGGQDSVAAISFKDENAKFKFAAFDLNSLNLNSH
jgi:hypothetical protein